MPLSMIPITCCVFFGKLPWWHLFFYFSTCYCVLVLSEFRGQSWCMPFCPMFLFVGTGKSCPVLTAPANGDVVGNGTAPGTGLFFSCRTPYVLQGSVVRYCDVSGTWSGVNARCTSMFELIIPTCTCDSVPVYCDSFDLHLMVSW